MTQVITQSQNFCSDFVVVNGEQVCQFNSSCVTVQAKAGCDIERVLRVRFKLWLSDAEKNPGDRHCHEYFCQVFVSEEYGRVFGWVPAI